jgi:hypothetical protein
VETEARSELVRVRRVLADLAEWGAEHLDDEYDRQYIAEYLTDSLIALIAGKPLPTAPF